VNEIGTPRQKEKIILRALFQFGEKYIFNNDKSISHRVDICGDKKTNRLIKTYTNVEAQ
jgi:hypothetical protein